MRKVFLLFFVLLIPVAFAGDFSIPYYQMGNVVINSTGNYTTSFYTTEQVLSQSTSGNYTICQGFFCWGNPGNLTITPTPPSGGGGGGGYLLTPISVKVIMNKNVYNLQQQYRLTNKTLYEIPYSVVIYNSDSIVKTVHVKTFLYENNVALNLIDERDVIMDKQYVTIDNSLQTKYDVSNGIYSIKTFVTYNDKVYAGSKNFYITNNLLLIIVLIIAFIILIGIFIYMKNKTPQQDEPQQE